LDKKPGLLTKLAIGIKIAVLAYLGVEYICQDTVLFLKNYIQSFLAPSKAYSYLYSRTR